MMHFKSCFIYVFELFHTDYIPDMTITFVHYVCNSDIVS